MQALDIDIDSYSWDDNQDIAIINGILTDRRLLGAAIQGVTAYAFARNSIKYGNSMCPICNTRYTLDRNIGKSSNHEMSKKHQNALNKKVTHKRASRYY